MNINGKHFRSLWWNSDAGVLEIIDQRWLPHELRIQPVHEMQDFVDAIYEMRVRGAPLIGATAAYGMARAMALDPSDHNLHAAWTTLEKPDPRRSIFVGRWIAAGPPCVLSRRRGAQPLRWSLPT